MDPSLQTAKPSPATVMANIIGVCASLATVIGVVGVLVAVLEYAGRGEAERAEATLQIVDSWEDDGYRAKFEQLSTDLATSLSQMSPAEVEAMGNLDPVEQAPLLTAIADNYMAANGEGTVDDLFYFFTKLSVCGSSELCSTHAVDAFFGEPISTFWLYFGPYAYRQRDLRTDFAEDVESYLLAHPQ